MDEKLQDEILSCLQRYRSIATSDVVADFAAMSEDALPMCHFGLGLYIRNNYLRPESKLYRLFAANGMVHPDNMSGIMIKKWHEVLNSRNQQV